MRFSANHSAVFTLVHQTTEFRQTTVYTTVVDPSHVTANGVFGAPHRNGRRL